MSGGGAGDGSAGKQVVPRGLGRATTPGRKMLEWDTIPSPPSFPDSGPRLCPYAVSQGPGSHWVIENNGGLGTHRGASEASRAGGTRLTTVSLEEKEADWSGALGWGGTELEGKMGPEEHSPGPRAGDSEGGRGKKYEAQGRVWVLCTYGGTTSSSGTSRAARTRFTLRGRDKRLRSGTHPEYS